MEAFQKAGCKVVLDFNPADASAYVLLQGIAPNSGDLWQLQELRWLGKRNAKKLAIVINEHKFVQSRREFFDEHGVVVGSEHDDPKIWTESIFVPCGLNPDMYRETTPRKLRPHKVGFRGSRYKSGKHNVDEERNRIVGLFSGHEEVKMGSEFFIRNRESLSAFLNTIKAAPGAEGGGELKIPVHRHMEAVGCKVAQVMYPGRFCGLLGDADYIQLNRDHSNLEEVLAKLEDEPYCEAMTSRVRERMCDTNTIDMGVKRILEWLRK